MEQKFLLYLLYSTLIEIRERAYEAKDERTFWLCDLLHNIPSSLESESGTQEAYRNLLNNVKHLGIEKWLEVRKSEFYNRFPEYEDQISN